MGSNAFPLFNQPKAGDNQFGAYGTNMPGVVPAASSPSSVTGNNTRQGGSIGAGYSAVPTLDAGLTNDFFNFLQGQVGKGATPFNLSATLPSTGLQTNPGQLTPGLTPIMQQLEDFYSGKASNIPGSGNFASLAKTGNPVDQTPAWQAMLAAQNKNTQNNAANLREQFAFAGSLKGTPFADAITNFYNQNTLNQNAQLTAATTAEGDAAAQRSLQASSALTSGSAQLGQVLQGLDQQAITSLFQEFVRTRPEYSPLLNMQFGGATTFPPTVKDNTFLSNLSTSFGAGLGGGLGKGISGGVSGMASSGLGDLQNLIPWL